MMRFANLTAASRPGASRGARRRGLETSLIRSALLAWLVTSTGMLAAGCGNTSQGMEKDVQSDSQAVGQVAHKAGADVRAVGAKGRAVVDNAGEAVTITPRVKTAIIRDPVLNNRKNQVNVSTSGSAVTLRGHVLTDRMKQRAAEDAQQVLDSHHSSLTVDNQLVLQP